MLRKESPTNQPTLYSSDLPNKGLSQAFFLDRLKKLKDEKTQAS